MKKPSKNSYPLSSVKIKRQMMRYPIYLQLAQRHFPRRISYIFLKEHLVQNFLTPIPPNIPNLVATLRRYPYYNNQSKLFLYNWYYM